MGNLPSNINLTPAQFQQLSRDSKYSSKDLRKICKRFSRLGQNDPVSVSDFQKIPEIGSDPLLPYVAHYLRHGDSTEVDICKLVMIISEFESQIVSGRRLERIFDIISSNGQYISKQDLYRILHATSNTKIRQATLFKMIDSIFSGNETIDIKQFIQLVRGT